MIFFSFFMHDFYSFCRTTELFLTGWLHGPRVRLITRWLTSLLPSRFDIRCKRTVVFLAFAQTAVDEAHQHHLGFEADGFVGGAVDVVMEDILKTVFLQPHA